MMDIKVTVSQDKMEAYLKVTNILPNETVDVDKIMEAVREAKVVHGIDYDAIRAFCREPAENMQVLIAKGDPPVNGENGKILFELKQFQKEYVTKDRVDFREFPVQKRIIVKKGQRIASIVPPTEGTPGRNVHGEEVKPKRGEEAKVSLGKNVALDEEGKYVIATTEGILKVEADKNFIEVSEYLEVDGNVDYNTGNIDFPGMVLVKGDVKPGFIVRAKGDIEINGVVEAATVISLEGRVKISGVKGKEKGLIKAKKDVTVRYAEATTIECETLYFDTSLLNCVVRVTNSIIGTGRNSSIVGGEYVAAVKIEADEIGSEFGVNTHLEVGINPYIREEIKLLRAQIELDKDTIQKLLNIVKQYKQLKEKNVPIPPDREEQFNKATRSLINLRAELEKNLTRLHELEEKLSRMHFNALIIARNILYPGVEVFIQKDRFYAEVELPKVVLKHDGERIVAGGYERE